MRAGIVLSSRGPRVLKQFTGIVRTAIFLTGILLFSAASAFSQMNTGEIDGIVRDPTGAVVPDATVTAVEAGTQLKYTTKTNASGEYLLAQLPVGQYNLTVNAQGFKQIVQPNVDVACRRPSPPDIHSGTRRTKRDA